jgi:glycosyltransferase involved in cell wall biosynthesis
VSVSRASTNETLRPLMLGKSWFPDELGGLDRYFRGLLEHLPEANGVVLGRRALTPDRVATASDHGDPLPWRLLAFWQAAQRAAPSADVIDAHFALYALAPLVVGRLHGKPLLLHFHGPWADEAVVTGGSSRLALRLRRLLEWATYRRADRVIVLTSAFRQVLVERYGVSPWAIHVEPPGVDLERFSPGSRERSRRRLGIPDGAFAAVCVRRLVPRMGIESLLEAWRGALADLPPDSRLLIAGEGPLREHLAAAAAAPGHDGTVHILGRVSDERLVDLYRAADIAVVPTLALEGFGLVVLEAAACGTASIVTAVGGLPEAVSGLDRSLVVPARNIGALRDRLLAARVSRPSAEAARRHAERYDWPRVAARHRQIARLAAGHSPPDRRLKVVYLDHTAQLSGGELALLRLLPHLDRVQPHLILAEHGPLVGRLHLAGISTEVLRLDVRARRLRRRDVRNGGITLDIVHETATYVLRLARRLRRLKPDLVHTNSLKAGVYGSLAARIAGIPMIWHVRDRIAEDYLTRPAVQLVRRMSRHLATAVVANSHSTMETLEAPSEPVVIYSVLPEVLTDVPARRRHTQSPLTFGIVGRLAPWKGQDLFLRAFSEAFPEGDERGVVVGAALFGEDDYADALTRIASDLGLDSRIEFRGHRDDVWEELSRLDVLVHASLTPEPFGQVILEGMAAGVPVIAAGAGGPAEMIRDDTNGLLYQPRDEVGLIAAMHRMRDPGLRERLTAAARQDLGRYSPRTVADELQQLYDTVAARGPQRITPARVP